MRDVMPAMPGVERQIFLQGHRAQFRMAKSSLPILWLERAQQPSPAIMKRIQQRQGDLHRSGLRVGQLRPTILGVGLDGRVVFGEGEFEAHVGVYMAVRDMVHDLAHGPAVGAVGGVQLGVGKVFDGGAQTLGEKAQRLDVCRTNARHAGGRRAETSNGKAEVFQIRQFGHGWNFNRSGTVRPYLNELKSTSRPSACAALGRDLF